MEPWATSDVLSVTVDVLASPFTVNVPALAVMEPWATSDVLAVIVDVLAKPLTVRMP